MAVRPDGRPALTLYQVERQFPHFLTEKLLTQLSLLATTAPSSVISAKNAGIDQFLPRLTHRDIEKLYQGFALLTVRPQTGRTHQIRAHLTHLGHPLVGDTTYLPRRKARLDPIWCPRQFLHAATISLTHPASGQPMTFSAPLPADLAATLEFLA